MYEQYNMKCLICERKYKNNNSHEACHIISDKNGGTATKDNTITACMSCNRSMGTKDLPIWVKTNWGEEHPNYQRVMQCLTDNPIYHRVMKILEDKL